MELAVTLPLGVWMDGIRYQDTALRPLTGADEAFLLDAGEAMYPARRLSALLDRCLQRLGQMQPVSPGTAGSLTVGDRQALALHLRHATLGNRLQSVLTCPDPDCGEKMDLDLKVSDLLLPPSDAGTETREATFDEDGICYRVSFRLPTGSDQEVIAQLALNDPQGAAERLMARCIDRVEREDGQPVGELPANIVERLEASMADLDPQAELILEPACPSCGTVFSTHLDAADFFFQELADRAPQLVRDVHLLARYYHWTEADIMDMPVKARRRHADYLMAALVEAGQR